MRRWRPSPANIAVAALLGCAAAIYAIRGLRPGSWITPPGVWDLLALVTTEPRFTGLILLTAVLLRSVLSPDAIVSETLRRGTYRRMLAHQASSSLLSMVLPTAAVLLATCVVAACFRLDLGTRQQPGSAAAALAAAHLPVPLGVLTQIALVAATLTVVEVALAAVRLISSSIVPVLIGALLCWSWMGVSILSLQTVINPNSGTSTFGAVAASLSTAAPAALNSSTYLDLIIAIETHGLPAVLLALAAVATVSYLGVASLDRRVRRGRRITQAAS